MVLTHPPFNDPRGIAPRRDTARGIAHMANSTTLSKSIYAARRILKSRGVQALIWRADGIAEARAALDDGFGSVQVLPVHGDAPGSPTAFWFAPPRVDGRRRKSIRACCSMMSQVCL